MSELQTLLSRLLDALTTTPGADVRWLKPAVLYAQVPRPETDVQARFLIIELASSPVMKGTMTIEDLRALNHQLTGTVRAH